ncbi:hypothetical protein AGMMS49525_11700 [Bacteroidia bacterium]|nr:hypothetical protein AGMMS49525_11610 [Bacteroidia bacterium]GHT04899.1 hypothetical protein AGMMS49525_11700 [Bacteroidia bacterium]
MSKTSTRTMQKMYGRALIQPDTLNTETREVEVVFATETPVARWSWEEDYNEILVCEAGAIRMERANKGLPVLDSHNSYSLDAQIGRSTKVWVNDKKEVCATLRFSKRAKVEDLFQDITDGIISDISVSYLAKNYFNKSPQWFYQRLNGNSVNGKPAKFTPNELMKLRDSLTDISTKINQSVASVV